MPDTPICKTCSLRLEALAKQQDAMIDAEHEMNEKCLKENAALRQRVANLEEGIEVALNKDAATKVLLVRIEELKSSLTRYGERVQEKAAKIADKHWSFTVGVEIRSMSLPPLNEEGVK